MRNPSKNYETNATNLQPISGQLQDRVLHKQKNLANESITKHYSFDGFGKFCYIECYVQRSYFSYDVLLQKVVDHYY